MIKYGVWFIGNAKESASLCYEGRNVFIADKLMQAVDKIDELEYSAGYELKDHFKVVKIEILE